MTRSLISGANRRQVVAAMATAGLVGLPGLARAQGGWKPPTPIKIVVPWPAGGGADLLSRLVAAGLGERGLSTIVENRPGASGTVGAEYVYRSPANGTILLAATADTLVIYPHLVKTRFEPLKFVPIRSLGAMPLYLIGRPNLPATNITELIALAKKQSLSYASPGVGTGPHMTVVDFARTAQIDNLLHVPFLGAAPLMQAVMTGQVDFSIINASLPAQFRSQIRILGGSGSRRVSVLSDIPTFTEQGLPLTIEPELGLFAPPETPADVTNALVDVLAGIIASPAYKAKLNDLAMTAPAGAHAEFARYIRDEHRRWGDVVRAANVKLE